MGGAMKKWGFCSAIIRHAKMTILYDFHKKNAKSSGLPGMPHL
jgi:hypothetical protein